MNMNKTSNTGRALWARAVALSGVSELARQAGLAKSSVSRIMNRPDVDCLAGTQEKLTVAAKAIITQAAKLQKSRSRRGENTVAAGLRVEGRKRSSLGPVGRRGVRELEEYRARVWGDTRGDEARVARAAELSREDVIEAGRRHASGQYQLTERVAAALRARAVELGLGEAGE